MTINNHPVEPEELMAYLDGELPPDRSADTASHLEQCRECQKLAADLQEVSQMLMTWQVEEPEREPAEVAEALKKRGPLAGSAVRGSWRGFLSPRRWPKPVWGFAAVGLVITLFVIFDMRTANKRVAALNDYDEPRVTSQMRTEPQSGPLPPSPSATPRPGVGTAGKLQRAETAKLDKIEEEGETSGVPTQNGPMIIRTAELEVITNQFDKARSDVDDILKRRHGYVGELNVNTPTGSARSLTGTLRVPANQLDATLADIKGLGRTEKESQGGEEVTQQYVDLQARLANAKHTEQRLTDILRERTGKLSDVLAVEIQISRVRGEIEQMEAQRKTMKNQVDFATLTVTLTEEYKEQLKAVPPSTGTQFRNAAIEGYRSLMDGIISILLWLLSAGPTLLLWGAILFFPARMVWRKAQDRRNRA